MVLKVTYSIELSLYFMCMFILLNSFHMYAHQHDAIQHVFQMETSFYLVLGN